MYVYIYKYIKYLYTGMVQLVFYSFMDWPSDSEIAASYFSRRIYSWTGTSIGIITIAVKSIIVGIAGIKGGRPPYRISGSSCTRVSG